MNPCKKQPNKKRPLFLAIAFVCLVACLLPGCKKAQSGTSKTGFYFDTVITITLYGDSSEEAFNECFDLAEKYEDLLSATVEGSDIWNINHSNGAPVPVSDETIALLEKSLAYSKATNGAFDITIGKLSSLWDFKSDRKEIPPESKIRSALSTVGYENIQINGAEVSLKNPDTAIDLGGIAKGYIADRMKEALNGQGITEGIINLGGNILTIGPKASGDPYRIGIQKPFANTGVATATVEITDNSLVSSGVYERYFEADGKIYHHILNPATGYPFENGLLGVTIVTPSSADADALSTSCFALGLEDGMDLIEHTEDAEAVFITEDGTCHLSSGMGEKIPFQEVD